MSELMRRTRSATAVLVFGFLPATFAPAATEPAAVPTIRPNDAAVDGSFIVPYTNSWQVTEVTADGKEKSIGIWTDEVTIVEEAGGPVLRRRQRLPGPSGYQVLVNRVRHDTLTPLSLEIRTDDERETLQRVDFETSRVQITVGAADPIQLELGEPIFDWFLYGLLVVGFPLSEDYAVRFPTMGPGARLEWRELRVVAREPVEALGQGYDCFKVESDDGLTFWVTRSAPYVIRLHKDEGDGTSKRWEMVTATAASELPVDAGFSSYLELRRYSTREGKRDRFLDYFEEHYLESQEVLGMWIWGQFRDLATPTRFVWLRGYREMDARQDGLQRFYTSTMWQETGPEVAGMLNPEGSRVHFLEPVSGSDAFAHRLGRPALLSEEPPSARRGIVVAQIYDVGEQGQAPVLASLRDVTIPAFTRLGAVSLGLFASSEEKNNFPALPYSENEKLLVWFASFEDRETYAAARSSITPPHPTREELLLEPGSRSRLRHRPVAAR